jgi:hypothetical protein
MTCPVLQISTINGSSSSSSNMPSCDSPVRDGLVAKRVQAYESPRAGPMTLDAARAYAQ